ncbi:hypothetical protein [Hymenobacter sp. B1770]|uniref:hypothetical protein n=1 Tax=Hymenobacter sp. B1770 TaxID=1718788 RepID=UPI003CEFA71E
MPKTWTSSCPTSPKTWSFTTTKAASATSAKVAGSLAVHPIKDYGATHIGLHRFCHVENGKNDCGNSKFVMPWQQQGDSWKITRVVSYDH